MFSLGSEQISLFLSLVGYLETAAGRDLILLTLSDSVFVLIFVLTEILNRFLDLEALIERNVEEAGGEGFYEEGNSNGFIFIIISAFCLIYLLSFL